MQIRRKIRNRIFKLLDNKIDLFGNKLFKKMRERGHILYLSELSPFFKGAKIYTFGTGGSIANLKDVSRLLNYNLMMTTTGPYYCYLKYGFVPNLWILTYAPIIEKIFENEKRKAFDLSNTFILVPTNESESKINIKTPVVKELMLKHPEATYVLYRCILHTRSSPIKVPITYLQKDIEPIHGISSNILDHLFFPVSFFLDVSTIYFSGVDLIPSTGHFWDRNLHYQTMDGKPLNFPEDKIMHEAAGIVQRICKQKNKKIFRLEKNETVLQSYPYIGFDKSLKEASPKISTSYARQHIEIFK